MTSPTIGHHVERAACGNVHERRYRQTDEHRDVGSPERLRHGPLEVLGAEEGNHGCEADAVGPQAAPVPTSIHAARIEYLTHRVMPFSNHIEVHEVDRGPGREQIQDDGQELAEFLDEVLRRYQREAG